MRTIIEDINTTDFVFINKIRFEGTTGYRNWLEFVLNNIDENNYFRTISFEDGLNDKFLAGIFTVNDKVGLSFPKKNTTAPYTKYCIQKNFEQHSSMLNKKYKIRFIVFERDGKHFYSYKPGKHIVNTINYSDKILGVVYQMVKTKIKNRSSFFYWFQKEENENTSFYDYLERIKVLDITEENAQDTLDEYYILRHNCLHSYICYLYGLNFYADTTLKLKSFGIESRQTPDFFEYDENEKICLIGDVSLSVDDIAQQINKENKYRELIEMIGKTKNVKTLFIILNNDFSNLSEKIATSKLDLIRERLPDVEQDFLLLHESLIEKTNTIKSQVRDILE